MGEARANSVAFSIAFSAAALDRVQLLLRGHAGLDQPLAKAR